MYLYNYMPLNTIPTYFTLGTLHVLNVPDSSFVRTRVLKGRALGLLLVACTMLPRDLHITKHPITYRVLIAEHHFYDDVSVVYFVVCSHPLQITSNNVARWTLELFTFFVATRLFSHVFS